MSGAIVPTLDVQRLNRLEASVRAEVIAAAQHEEQARTTADAALYGEVYAFLYIARHALETAAAVLEA